MRFVSYGITVNTWKDVVGIILKTFSIVSILVKTNQKFKINLWFCYTSLKSRQGSIHNSKV